MTLAAPRTLAVARRVDVRIELLPGSRPLRHGARVRVHQGTADSMARVSLSAIRAPSNPESPLGSSHHERGPWRRVELGAADVEVPPGGEALARLRLTTTLVLTRGDRMVLRAPSPAVTIGGAVVLDPEPPAGAIRRERAGDRLMALTTTDSVAWARTIIAEAGIRGLTPGDLTRRGGMSPAEVDRVVRELVERGAVIPAGDAVLDAEVAANAQAAIIKLLTGFHRAHPGEAGMPREVVRDHVRAGAKLEALLAGLGASVVGTDRLALSSHQPVVSGDDARVMATVERALKAAGAQPPDIATLAASAQASAAMVQKALFGLVKTGRAAARRPLVSRRHAGCPQSRGQGVGPGRADRRAVGEGKVRSKQKVCDSAAGVSGPGADYPAIRRHAGRDLNRHRSRPRLTRVCRSGRPSWRS